MAEELPPANLILQALHGIRTDLKGLAERLDATNQRLDATNQRLDATNQRLEDGLGRLESRLERLEQRTTQGFIETNSKLAELTRIVSEHDQRLDHLLREGMGAEVRSLRARMDRVEKRLDQLVRKKSPNGKSR